MNRQQRLNNKQYITERKEKDELIEQILEAKRTYYNIRDLNDRSEYPDGRIINSFMMSGCHLYDMASARELLLNKFNSSEQV